MTNVQSYEQQNAPVPQGWVGLTSLSTDQLNRQIVATSAKLAALEAELASRTKAADRSGRA